MVATEWKDKWLYDIYLNGHIVGNQGDEAFDTREDAIIDANQYIEEALCKEYNANGDDFEVEYYQAQY